MAKGKSHDKFNLYLGAFFTGSIVGLFIGINEAGPFMAGWVIGTLFLSPDLDIGPKKRAGILGTALYPYSLLFKHRGISHHFLWGTLSRVVYLYIMAMFIIFLLSKMGEVTFAWDHFFNSHLAYFQNYSYERREYLWPTWLLFGLTGADWSHYFLDKISSWSPWR